MTEGAPAAKVEERHEKQAQIALDLMHSIPSEVPVHQLMDATLEILAARFAEAEQQVLESCAAKVEALAEALRGLLEVAHHDCGGSEVEHLLEHLAPASMRALDALADD